MNEKKEQTQHIEMLKWQYLENVRTKKKKKKKSKKMCMSTVYYLSQENITKKHIGFVVILLIVFDSSKQFISSVESTISNFNSPIAWIIVMCRVNSILHGIKCHDWLREIEIFELYSHFILNKKINWRIIIIYQCKDSITIINKLQWNASIYQISDELIQNWHLVNMCVYFG